MVRPIKIFLYYLLIILLIITLDQLINDAGFSLFPKFGTRQTTARDSLMLLNIAREEVIDKNDTSLQTNIHHSALIIPSDSIDAKIYISNDSALIAPYRFRKLFAAFCKEAAQTKEKRSIIRILHMGDSQIEADRITGTLRQKFQEKYGGSGPGFIMPYDPLHINANVHLENKGNWHLAYSYRHNDYPGKPDFGFAAKAAWFQTGEAGFTISPIPWKNDRTQNFSVAKLFTTTGMDSLKIKVTADTALLASVLLPPSPRIQTFVLSNLPSGEKINFHFTSDDAPAFHGLTLDGEYGIAVDNIAMRGRPWPGIRLAENKLLKSMAEEMNIRLFLLQFGTNVLPTQTDNYHFYYTHFIRELRILQNLFPDIPVLVVGVQSAATLIDNKVKPLKHARLIADAQRAATLECDMGFIDLQKVMGGTNAAVEWAGQEPPLISSDYMHFTQRGARKIGSRIWMLMDSLSAKSLAETGK
ncbi:MAG: hypothetical protein PWR04_1244 [Anaerophaga sp.]|nr:hypothetical protein [Anaerophaga sp.]